MIPGDVIVGSSIQYEKDNDCGVVSVLDDFMKSLIGVTLALFRIELSELYPRFSPVASLDALYDFDKGSSPGNVA